MEPLLVIAVAGRRPSFCAGGNFRQFLELHERGDNPVDFLADVSARFSRIAASPKPWVAVVHGHAVARGLELALACDVVAAADTTLIVWSGAVRMDRSSPFSSWG
ncbi:enoyl-CoA hydratase/isomerase family protein [Streptomyces sp. SD31]|uniref:enoyl-CoA hydratase/isomerase family protein n=1 Tax=Streptomyces sp. SD31 TaxID=3452208 RepID=UPI003F894664